MRCLHEGRADGALDLERLGELAAVERDLAPLLATCRKVPRRALMIARRPRNIAVALVAGIALLACGAEMLESASRAMYGPPSDLRSPNTTPWPESRFCLWMACARRGAGGERGTGARGRARGDARRHAPRRRRRCRSRSPPRRSRGATPRPRRARRPPRARRTTPRGQVRRWWSRTTTRPPCWSCARRRAT